MARIKGINPKMAEIGKIKIGKHSEKKTGTGYNLPTRLDHFLVTTTEKDKAKLNFLPDEQVMDVLGDEPTEIPVLLPFDDPDLCFMTSYALYKGRQCLCRGDGETASMIFLKDGKPKLFTLLDTEEFGDSVQKNERRTIVCDPVYCPNRQPDAKGAVKCKPNGRGMFIIPASKRLNGYYGFRTTSYNTIAQMLGALDAMKEQSGGILKGIPAKLFWFKKNTADHGNVPVVSIDWDFDAIQDMRQAAISELEHRTKFNIDVKLIENQARQSGILNDNDDPADVEREFYTENTPEYAAQKNKIANNIEDRADSVLDAVEDADFSEVEDEQEPGNVQEDNRERNDEDSGQSEKTNDTKPETEAKTEKTDEVQQNRSSENQSGSEQSIGKEGDDGLGLF